MADFFESDQGLHFCHLAVDATEKTMLLITTLAFLIAWLSERSRRKYEEARANAFIDLSAKLKARLRAKLDSRLSLRESSDQG
jgi:hypothetical protein